MTTAWRAEAAAAADPGLRWREGFAALGPDFYTELLPAPIPALGRPQRRPRPRDRARPRLVRVGRRARRLLRRRTVARHTIRECSVAMHGLGIPTATRWPSTLVERLRKVPAHPCDEPVEPTAQDRADAGFPPDWAQSIEVSCSS